MRGKEGRGGGNWTQRGLHFSHIYLFSSAAFYCDWKLSLSTRPSSNAWLVPSKGWGGGGEGKARDRGEGRAGSSSSWPCGVFGRALNADNKNVSLLDDCRFINKVLHLNWKWAKGEEEGRVPFPLLQLKKTKRVSKGWGWGRNSD